MSDVLDWSPPWSKSVGNLPSLTGAACIVRPPAFPGLELAVPRDAAAGIETLVEHALDTTVAGIEHLPLLAAAAFALLTTTSYAGTYDADTEICKGTVNVGSQWTTVIDETGSYKPCRFSTTSKLGHRILTVCPNRSRCIIDASTTGHLALRTIKAVTFVKQAVKVCGRM